MKLLTLARDLQRRKARERHRLFVAEGVRTVETLLSSALPIEGLLVSAGFGNANVDRPRESDRERALIETAATRRIPVTTVTESELESAADTETPQGVLAIAPIPSWPSPVPKPVGARFLVLDALQDPGNVGTVIRTAAALGVQATFALPGTVDVWNAKVVRGSMGALFVHPVLQLDWTDVAGFLAQHAVGVWAADMDGAPLQSAPLAAERAPLALVVSNEGAGLSPAVAASVTRTVTIPMAPDVESLNVGVAAGILLYAMRYQEPTPS
ncbi:MAG: RNA methyltransferase [Gemmatimonadaceae bacterium]|nr:RNA methyltransferase [Gemmatimonadaceae bacterium]